MTMEHDIINRLCEREKERDIDDIDKGALFIIKEKDYRVKDENSFYMGEREEQ
jgi:hypothetical protein